MVIPVLDSAALRGSSRGLEGPFRLQAAIEGASREVLCGAVLRHLPGKRVVCRSTWEGRPAVLKLFLDRRRGTAHRSREAAGLRALVQAGMDAPDVLAEGTLDPDGSPVLVLAFIPEGVELERAWREARNASRQAVLTAHLADTLARMHGGGLVQRDLHLRNFLWDGARLWSLDGDGVDARRAGRPLPRAASLANLGLLAAQLPPGADFPGDGFRERYLRGRGWEPGAVPPARWEAAVRRARGRRRRMLLKKTLRECSAFVCRRSWRRFAVWDRRYDSAGLRALAADPGAFCRQGRVLKEGNTSSVYRVTVEGLDLAVKQYHIKNRLHAWRQSLRRGRARRSWLNAQRLVMAGIATPPPVLLVEERWGLRRSTAWFVSEYVAGTNVYARLRSPEAHRVDLPSLARQFRELFLKLAQADLSHGDCKIGNYLVTPEGLSVIDLDAMTRHRFPGRTRAALARDVQRFLRNWHDMPEPDRVFREALAGLPF